MPLILKLKDLIFINYKLCMLLKFLHHLQHQMLNSLMALILLIILYDQNFQIVIVMVYFACEFLILL
jgi:hypothetical protein